MSKARRITVLIVSTFAFMVCFAVWMMLRVTGIPSPIREQLGLDSTQFGVLTATPVFTEALL
jgi:MFS transporter, NNP family, nitrate/nitrite transporter